jgi:hypothetical protein
VADWVKLDNEIFGFINVGVLFARWETVNFFRNDCPIAINLVIVLYSRGGTVRYSTSVQTSRCACDLHHDLHCAICYSASSRSLYNTH